MTRLGIIDIGSNSIKSLVVQANDDGSVCTIGEGRSPTRIGTGLSDTPPRIRIEDIAHAADAISGLIAAGRAQAETFCRTQAADAAAPTSASSASAAAAGTASIAVPAAAAQATPSPSASVAPSAQAAPACSPAPVFHLYATSAIREASNRAEVVGFLSEECAAPLTVLSGEEEATLIAWAARSMPSLATYPELMIADLGGGSLELVHVLDGVVKQACSLHLGAVRLNTEFFEGGRTAISPERRAALGAHIDELLGGCGFDFDAARGALFVGSGGALSAMHHMKCFVGKEGALGDIPLMPVAAMHELYLAACERTMIERVASLGFPKNRADIMPAALQVLLALAARTDSEAYAYCIHNLRFGIAAMRIHEARTGRLWRPSEPIPAISIEY